MERLRKDSMPMGMILGLLAPAALFGIIYGILTLIFHCTGKLAITAVFEVVSAQKIILLSVIPNLFLLRYYLLKLKFDLTGRGILLITFAIGIAFAILEFI